MVDSFRNNGLAFAGLLASSYAYLDNHMDGVASSHIHHNGLDDGDPSLEHALKRYHADLGTVNKLNDDVDGARYTHLFAAMIMVWHIHMIMHVWRDHMLMIGCIHIFKCVIGIFLVIMIHLAVHIVHVYLILYVRLPYPMRQICFMSLSI